MATRTDMRHLEPSTSKFGAIYRGVIENNNDPDQLGRCKIRVWGVHDELKEEGQQEGISTDNLPWGEPALGLIEGSMSGHGLFSVPLQGSHVFCFFEGGNWESLRYFATVPGLPIEESDPTKGFNDPDGDYPRSDRLGESDYHRLSRGISDGTIVDHKNDNLDLGVVQSDDETWDEPESAFAAEYPKNIVLTTHRGITVEIDSTTGSERVHIFHPSNTYIEIDADGNVVFRNEGNRFEITKGDRNKHIFGDDSETVDVDKKSYVKGDETNKIDGDQKITVGNNLTEDVGANETQSIVGDKTQTVGGDWDISVTGNITITAGGNVKITGAQIDLN